MMTAYRRLLAAGFHPLVARSLANAGYDVVGYVRVAESTGVAA